MITGAVSRIDVMIVPLLSRQFFGEVCLKIDVEVVGGWAVGGKRNRIQGAGWQTAEALLTNDHTTLLTT